MADDPTTSNEHRYEVDGKSLGEVSNRQGEEANESSMTQRDPHECLRMEMTCVSRTTPIKGIPTRKGSHKIRVLISIFPTRKDPLRQETNVSFTLL